MGKIIDWLWNNTVSPEAQELVHDDYLAIEHSVNKRHWQKCVDAMQHNTDDEEYQQALANDASESYDESMAAAKELQGRGYQWDGSNWVREVEIEDEDEDETDEDDEEQEEQPQRSFFSRLIFG